MCVQTNSAVFSNLNFLFKKEFFLDNAFYELNLEQNNKNE